MTLLHDILRYNQEFVETKRYQDFQTTKFPDKGLVILTCMDTRLEELLPQAMNLGQGDYKIIKNAGAIVAHPFGSIMRSILVALYELKAEEVCVVGHHDCGMSTIKASSMVEKMIKGGIPEETIHILQHAGIDLSQWLRGFDHVADAVRSSVELIRNHPLLPASTPVHGLIIDPHTGKLDLVVDGYERMDRE
jgi:carbonic anhydrase